VTSHNKDFFALAQCILSNVAYLSDKTVGQKGMCQPGKPWTSARTHL